MESSPQAVLLDLGLDPLSMIPSCLCDSCAEDEVDERLTTFSLAALSLSAREFSPLCTPALRSMRQRLAGHLARRMVPLAAHAHGEVSLRKALSDLDKRDVHLLRCLLDSPEPLLGLTSKEGRIASWVLMRLSLLGGCL